jgi:hypothetical protein
MQMNESKLLENILGAINQFFKKIEWYFDIYFIWMLYSPSKYDRYADYLEKKWGKDGKK